MDFTKIKKVDRPEEYLPTKKLKDLEVSQDLHIANLRQVQTKHCIRIIVDVEESYSVFLPARMVKILNDDSDLWRKTIEACEENRLEMRYLGGKYNQIEFNYV